MAGPEERLTEERARLAEQVAALTRTFDQVVESSALDMTADDEHDPDGATIAFERQQVAALLAAARRRLADVEAALERLVAGTFGRCESCGGAIAPERLEVIPGARTCISCARG